MKTYKPTALLQIAGLILIAIIGVQFTELLLREVFQFHKWKLYGYIYYVLFSIGVAMYCSSLFPKFIGRASNNIRLLQIILFLAVTLLSDTVRHGLITYLFCDSIHTIQLMFERNIFTFNAVMVLSFIGLFIPKKAGYILLMLYPYILVGHIVKGSICIYTHVLLNFIYQYWFSYLVFVIITPILCNLKIMRNYFKIQSNKQLLACHLIATGICTLILLFAWEY